MICCSRGPTDVNFSSMNYTSRIYPACGKWHNVREVRGCKSCTRVFTVSVSIRSANPGAIPLRKREKYDDLRNPSKKSEILGIWKVKICNSEEPLNSVLLRL